MLSFLLNQVIDPPSAKITSLTTRFQLHITNMLRIVPLLLEFQVFELADQEQFTFRSSHTGEEKPKKNGSFLTDPVQPGLFYKHLRNSLIESLIFFLQTFKTPEIPWKNWRSQSVEGLLSTRPTPSSFHYFDNFWTFVATQWVLNALQLVAQGEALKREYVRIQCPAQPSLPKHFSCASQERGSNIKKKTSRELQNTALRTSHRLSNV